MEQENQLSMNDLLLYVHGSAVIQVLRSAVELDVFRLLYEHQQLTLAEINGHVRIDRQSIRTLFMGLASLRLVVKKGDKFSNASAITKLLDDQEWEVFKALVLFQAYIVYPGQVDYFESLVAGQNIGIRRYPGEGLTLYEKFRFDPRTKHIFYLYMNSYSDYAIASILEHLDFSSDEQILDVGGGGGRNAIAIASRYPDLKITLLDLPPTRELCEEEIRKHGLSERVKFSACDIFADEFPAGFDSVLFFHELMIWNHRQIEFLLRKAHYALNPGGRTIIFGSVSNDSEDGPLMAALDTVYFRSVAAGQGMVYPWKDYEKILKKVGYSKITRIECSTWTPHGIIVAEK